MKGSTDNSRKLCSFLCLFAAQLVCLPAAAIQLTGSLGIHDPSRIHKEDGRYYTFSTGFPGNPIRLKYSDNLTHWQSVANGTVFPSIPQWAQDEVPNNPGFMWAPSVIHFNNEYRMYYSVSSFTSQNSVIGLATNRTLDFNDPNYEWVDKQLVIESEPFPSYPYNAIDPGVFYDESTSRMWMTWGSYWNGIYITELDPATGKRITPNSFTLNIARRAPGSGTAIEAPYLTEHDGFYYLFVNWDSCCQFANSTYNLRVGRGPTPAGPFVDRSGTAMIDGGGDLFLGTEGSVIGPGHFSEFSEDGTDYFGYHYYDGNDNGNAKYAIEEFVWTADGWPVRVSELPPGDYNHNGIVDAADYTVWRDTLGSTTDLRANGSNVRGSFGVIDQADYDLWRINFGATYSGSGAASSLESTNTIPEPSSLCFAIMAIATLALHRRTHG